MQSAVEYLSGNVPGGIYLLLVSAAVAVIALLFLYRVNEFFTRRLFFRWLFISLTVLAILYGFFWTRYPPSSIYNRYTIDEITTNTGYNWLGKNLCNLISGAVKPFQNKHTYFFPQNWLYRMIPPDPVEGAKFRKRIYRKMPVQKVLTGSVIRKNDQILVKLSLVRYPSEKILKSSEGKFNLKKPEEFLRWVKNTFGSEIPFKKKAAFPLPAVDSLLTMAKWHFFRREYQATRKILNSAISDFSKNPVADNWLQFAEIRLAGIESLKHPQKNPYSTQIPGWQKKLDRARDRLILLLQKKQEEPLTNLLVAESYIWEEQFTKAGIFLKQAYVQNPFQPDVLLNFSFLHPTRYRELGYKNRSEIYQNILTLCPVDEDILLTWSKYILENHPAYTPSPDFARNFLERYLKMNPYSSEVWVMLGEIYSRQAYRQKALHAFLKADSLKPKSGRINYDIGVLYQEWEKPELAKKYFLRSIRYDDYLDSHLYLGAIYKNEKKFEKALEQFRYRVAHKTGDDDVYAYQAMKGIQLCLKALGRPVE